LKLLRKADSALVRAGDQLVFTDADSRSRTVRPGSGRRTGFPGRFLATRVRYSGYGYAGLFFIAALAFYSFRTSFGGRPLLSFLRSTARRRNADQ
jgi:hypothetical protein